MDDGTEGLVLRFRPLPPFRDVRIIDFQRHRDSRGWFKETFKASEFAKEGLPRSFVQDNLSFSDEKGTLRGLHFQAPPKSQGKLICCLTGRVFEAVVDVRERSPTFGAIATLELDAGEDHALWIPAGYAHGFQTLKPGTLVTYKATAEYAPAYERVLRWDDPKLQIPWPISSPILSPRDRAGQTLAQLFSSGRSE